MGRSDGHVDTLNKSSHSNKKSRHPTSDDGFAMIAVVSYIFIFHNLPATRSSSSPISFGSSVFSGSFSKTA